MSISLIVIMVIVATAFWFVVVYNRMVALRQNTQQALADIDVQLKARYDLVPNLVETVKGYAAHESETLDAVISARNSAMSAGGARSVQAQAQAEGMLGAALGRLVALSEAYPDLKANSNFQQLMEELSALENKLAAARRFFNNAVGEYNTAMSQFPAVLIAKPMGFFAIEYFDVGADVRAAIEAAPQVKF